MKKSLLFLFFLMVSKINAETINATFRYSDFDPATNTSVLKPIQYAYIEIWSAISPLHGWIKETSITTDVNGEININMQYKQRGVKYAIRILAQNYACRINKLRELTTFYANPVEKNGRGETVEIIRIVKKPEDILNFSCDFTDTFTSQHFNVAATILKGYDYASDHREPSETDIVEPVIVTSELISQSSYYFFTASTIQLKPEYYFQDFAILHEYAHHLENYISTFAAIISVHNGCNATGWDGKKIEGLKAQELAWMEGFADFFAQAVPRYYSTEVFYGESGTSSKYSIEYPYCNSPDHADEIEIFVGAVLWDLIDISNPVTDTDEVYDDFQDMDDQIFQIFDKELDNGVWPTFSHFIKAWNTRGLRKIDDIICQNTWKLRFNNVKRIRVSQAKFKIINNNQAEIQIDAINECGYLIDADIYDKGTGVYLAKANTKFIMSVNCTTTKKTTPKVVNQKPLIIVQFPCEIVNCNPGIISFTLKKSGYPDIESSIILSKSTCK